MDRLEEQRNTGLKIQYYRKLKKLTQWDMANALAITVTYVSLIERGHYRVGSELLFKIAQVLGVFPEELDPYRFNSVKAD